MNKTILVTGGAGFIGTNFVHYIYNKYPDSKILVLDALTYAGNVEYLPETGLHSDRFEFWHGDILNTEIVDHLVSRSDYIFHFAAESHVTRSIFDNRKFFETDVLGTQSICNAVLKNHNRVELLVHISTSEVYGTAMSELMNEDHPLNPLSPYASAKCGADRLVYSYYKTYGIPAVIIRPFNNYGGYQHLEKVVPRFITSCILDEPLTVHGDGTARRDYLYVQDHCEALDRFFHFPLEAVVGEVINLGSGGDIGILEMALFIKELMGNDSSEIVMLGDRPGQVFRHTCDPSKALKMLGWKAQTSWEQGLEATVKWYKEHQELWAHQCSMRRVPIVSADGRSEYH